MMRDRWGWESHEVAGTNLVFAAIDFRDSPARDDVDPFLFGVMQMIDERFLSSGNPPEVHAGALKPDHPAELRTDNLRVRDPRMRKASGLFGDFPMLSTTEATWPFDALPSLIQLEKSYIDAPWRDANRNPNSTRMAGSSTPTAPRHTPICTTI